MHAIIFQQRQQSFWIQHRGQHQQRHPPNHNRESNLSPQIPVIRLYQSQRLLRMVKRTSPYQRYLVRHRSNSALCSTLHKSSSKRLLRASQMSYFSNSPGVSAGKEARFLNKLRPLPEEPLELSPSPNAMPTSIQIVALVTSCICARF